MIAFLEGRLEIKQLTSIVLNVCGVGYEVTIPLSSYDQLPEPGGTCRLLIHHHITAADQKLYGFCTGDERDMFVHLLTISGVGPRLAVGALSGLPVHELKNAVACGDVKRISSISGIGKKTAERIVVELRDKFNAAASFDAFATSASPAVDSRMRDAVLALSALGHTPSAAARMVQAVAPDIKSGTIVADLVRMALAK